MTTRRHFLGQMTVAVGGVLGAPTILRSAPEAPDLILRGGVIIDGLGRPRFQADLAITGDRITAIGRKLREKGAVEIDCRDRIVAPGFVDVHSHGDGTVFDDPMQESLIRQGVTTIIVGADGSSRAPAMDPDGDAPLTIAAVLERFDRVGPSTNIGTLVGLGSVRELVIGEADRPATPAELRRMVTLVERALADGALGTSSGLEYTPGAFASLEELVALCTPLAERGLAYHTHMRNEDDALIEAVEEAIVVARGAKCGLQIAHLKTQGPRNWPKLDTVFERIGAARATGLDVAFDRYPYLAYHTGLTNLFPAWTRDGGMTRFFERIEDRDTADRIRAEANEKAALIGGWENVQISRVSVAEDEVVVGQRLGSFAQQLSLDPYEVAVGLLRRNDGSVGMIGFAMSEENLEKILAHPQGMVASDGTAYAISGPARRGSPHPRGAGSFARVLGRYVRERKALTLEQAVQKMTALPASRVGITSRGRLAIGAYADVVVFDADRVTDRADFRDPFQYAEGITATIVNGGLTFVDGGRGLRTGRALRG